MAASIMSSVPTEPEQECLAENGNNRSSGGQLQLVKERIIKKKSSEYDAYSLIFREYPDVVDVKQLCKMLGGISTKTACRLLQENKIEHFTIGRIYKIPKIHVLEYLKILSKLPGKD